MLSTSADSELIPDCIVPKLINAEAQINGDRQREAKSGTFAFMAAAKNVKSTRTCHYCGKAWPPEGAVLQAAV